MAGIVHDSAVDVRALAVLPLDNTILLLGDLALLT